MCVFTHLFPIQHVILTPMYLSTILCNEKASNLIQRGLPGNFKHSYSMLNECYKQRLSRHHGGESYKSYYIDMQQNRKIIFLLIGKVFCSYWYVVRSRFVSWRYDVKKIWYKLNKHINTQSRVHGHWKRTVK